ncbi:hypothetical protein CASFOL_014451 [Castilleja foliolosa]|uniref:Uncharacterized protein n=1 Tax=Castilleja foliolosa TaxID=1961234 RepID=A0ABD3DPM4_9LAMI
MIKDQLTIMGPYNNSKITNITISISLFYLLCLTIVTFASSPSLQTSPPAVSSATDNDNNHLQLQGFRIKKTTQVFLNSRQNKNLEKVVLYRSKSEKTKSSSTDDQRRFSAMLPKGNVAGSSSSACHNVMYPNSITFFCELSAEMTEP